VLVSGVLVVGSNDTAALLYFLFIYEQTSKSTTHSVMHTSLREVVMAVGYYRALEQRQRLHQLHSDYRCTRQIQ
jgi:hypothetical protein